MDEELNEPLPYWDWTQEDSDLPSLWSELRNAVLTDWLVEGIWLNVDSTHVSMKKHLAFHNSASGRRLPLQSRKEQSANNAEQSAALHRSPK